VAAILRRLNLRFPVLFALFAIATAVDLVIPDVIPFVDEIGLALLTLLFGLWRDRRPGAAPGAGPNRRPR
jgi:hypothetical protein